MLEIVVKDRTGEQTSQYVTSNASTAQTVAFYDGYYAVALTGGYRPKYSDLTKKVRFTSILVACDEKGNVNKDFAQVLELGANLSKIIYKGNLLSVAKPSDYVTKWKFSGFGDGTPVFTLGMVVKITSVQQYGFVKPFGFDVRKEFSQNADGNYVIREDAKALHSVFTISNANVVAPWATPGKNKKNVDGFYDEDVKQAIEKHISNFFKQQVEFAAVSK